MGSRRVNRYDDEIRRLYEEEQITEDIIARRLGLTEGFVTRRLDLIFSPSGDDLDIDDSDGGVDPSP